MAKQTRYNLVVNYTTKSNRVSQRRSRMAASHAITKAEMTKRLNHWLSRKDIEVNEIHLVDGIVKVGRN